MSHQTNPEGRPKRRRKLIDRPLQFRLVATIAGVGVLALIVQATVLQILVVSMTRHATPQTAEVLSLLPGKVALVMLISAGLLLPLAFVVGIVFSFPVVGPLYRFRVYLNDVLAGRETGPCRLRAGDKLKDLAELITAVSEPMRAQAREEHEDDQQDSLAA